ncbi:MAG: hypothetical protein OXC62_02045 [Aestuariivita sp.]|nr:hypothetical protein [Aestuariivita sp.]
MKHSFRKHLLMAGLLKIMGTSLAALPDERRIRFITFKDGLLSALVVFHQKVPSLLQCDVMMRVSGRYNPCVQSPNALMEETNPHRIRLCVSAWRV